MENRASPPVCAVAERAVEGAGGQRLTFPLNLTVTVRGVRPGAEAVTVTETFAPASLARSRYAAVVALLIRFPSANHR